MQVTLKLLHQFILVLNNVQISLITPATLNHYRQLIDDAKIHLPESGLFQSINLPQGLPILLLILIPVCGGALILGVVAAWFAIKRRNNQHPSVAPDKVMAEKPSSIPHQPASSAPSIYARCPQCGATLSLKAKFCPQCGTSLEAQQNPPVNPNSYSTTPQVNYTAPHSPSVQGVNPAGSFTSGPNLQSEPIIGIIRGLAQQKGLSARQYNLVVTQHRLIFARLNDQMLKLAMSQAKEEAQGQGRGFFGQLGAMTRANARLCERYYHTPIDVIIRETPENFVVYPQQIRRARIHIANAFDETNNNVDRLVIHSSTKMTFLLKGSNARETKQILQQALGNIVK